MESYLIPRTSSPLNKWLMETLVNIHAALRTVKGNVKQLFRLQLQVNVNFTFSLPVTLFIFCSFFFFLSFHLFWITFLFKNKGPPEINSRREKSVKLNSTLQVDCLVRGFPQPEVNWTRDGKLLNTTNKLTIKQVTYGDAGQYTCSAKNSEGKREAAFQVTVTGKC